MQAALPDQDVSQISVWARRGAAGLIGTFLGVALAVVWQFMLARLLGPTGLGIVSLGSSALVALTALLPLGMDAAAMRYVSHHLGRQDPAGARGVIRSTVYTALGLGLLVSPILIWQSNTIAVRIFNKPELGAVLQILFLGLPLSILVQVLASVLQGYQKIAAQALIQQVLVPALRIVGLVALVLGLRSVSLGGVAAVIVLASSCGAFILALVVWRAARLPAQARATAAMPQPALIGYSLQALLIAAVEQLNVVAPVFLLGTLSASSQIGIFGVAFRAALVLGLFLVGLNLIAAPASSSLLASGDTASVGSLYRTITRWGLTLALPFFLVLILLAPNVMGIFGPAFRAGSLSLQVLAIGQIINVGTGPCRWLLNVSDRQRLNVLNGTIGLLAGLCLGIWLIPTHGALGAAIATAAAAASVNLIGLAQTYRALHLQPYEKAFIKPVLAGLVSAGVGLLVNRALAVGLDWARLLLGAALILVTYAITLVILRPEGQDKTVLRTLLQRND